MFSRRSTFETSPNRWSAARAEALRRGDRLLDLTESNPTAADLPYPEDAILQALADPRSGRYEPEPFGLPSARRAIADSYARSGASIDPSRIVVTASTSEAYSFLFHLLADPGDIIAVPAPGYPLVDILARLASLQVVRYPLDGDDGWALDVGALEGAATAGTRAVLLVNPGNPTGRFLHREERVALEAACSRNGWAVISDEVFASYVTGPDPSRVPCAADGAGVLTFSLGGLSKSAGLPQMKLGWIALGGPEAQVHAALERLEVIADAYLSVSAPVQHALPKLMRAGDRVAAAIRERLARNRDALSRALAGGPGRLLPAEGGWQGVLQVPAIRTGEEWALRLLQDDHVLVHPGYLYDFPKEAYLVVSLLTPRRVVDEAAARLSRRLLAGPD